MTIKTVASTALALRSCDVCLHEHKEAGCLYIHLLANTLLHDWEGNTGEYIQFKSDSTYIGPRTARVNTEAKN